MGFSEFWINLICACLDSSWFSILINGSPTREFPLKHGLKQGDLLSPFLFIVAMEGLHVVVQDAVLAGIFRGIHVDDESILLSYLCYDDDAIFFGEWYRDNIMNSIGVLCFFYMVYGL